ncbi:MAG: GNAT family N-acetyltransferase [Eubacteriales bacterium]
MKPEFTIRKTTQSDIDSVLEIYRGARESIGKLGIDQWQNGYPSRTVLEDDIRNSRSYVVCDGEEVAATFALIDDGEPSYDEISDGHWLTGDENRNYAAVHRVAVAVSRRGSGAAGAVVKFSADFAREHGMTSVRIDTHEGNVVMRKMLEKNGFVCCGVIHLIGGSDDGKPRVAYELKVN